MNCKDKRMYMYIVSRAKMIYRLVDLINPAVLIGDYKMSYTTGILNISV